MLDEASDPTSALLATPTGAVPDMQTQPASPEEIASSLGGSAAKPSEEGSPRIDAELTLPEKSEPKSVQPEKSPPSPTSSLPSSASKMAKSDVL